MAMRLLLVTVVLTGLSYAHMVQSVTEARERDLLDYVRLRSAREGELFRLAEDHHRVVIAALLERLRDMGETDPVEEFDKRYRVHPDGVLRASVDGFDATRTAQVFIDDETPKTKAIRQMVIVTQDVITNFGRAMAMRFVDTWAITPDNININYWPTQPRWMFEAKADAKFYEESFYTIATPQKNPARATVWTEPYIDPQAAICMVSAVSPIYDGDRFLGVVGHDLPLAQLVRRTMEEHLDGAYNVLLRSDGHLVAHPMLADAIVKAGGNFDVATAGDAALAALTRSAVRVSGQSAVVQSEDGSDYLAVARVPGPNWLLVTVVPTIEMQKIARRSARVVLIGGFFALLVELGLMYWLLRGAVARPLAQIRSAAEKVTMGDTSFVLDASRDDELGAVASSFNVMATAVRERSEAQERALVERKDVEEHIRGLYEELEKNLEREQQRAATLEELARAVEKLGTPVLTVWQGILALPVIGHVDARRAATMMQKLLEEVQQRQCTFVILDITGVDALDAEAAEGLISIVRAVELVGARCVFTGVSASVARAVVGNGIGFGGLVTRRTLAQGLEWCLAAARKK
jgi:methyl-accepting chemotaxis protein